MVVTKKGEMGTFNEMYKKGKLSDFSRMEGVLKKGNKA